MVKKLFWVWKSVYFVLDHFLFIRSDLIELFKLMGTFVDALGPVL